MKPKVFIVTPVGDGPYHKMFRDQGWVITNDMSYADIVQFTGGEDVSPSLYERAQHPATCNNPRRDAREALVFDVALNENIPMAGICRGGQFLNVMCGGEMYQHADNHGRPHGMYDNIVEEYYEVTSTHHQIMKPSEEAKVLAIAWETSKREHIDEAGDTILETLVGKDHPGDAEVVFYQQFDALCFQPHPEFDGQDRLAEAYFDFLRDYPLKL